LCTTRFSQSTPTFAGTVRCVSRERERERKRRQREKKKEERNEENDFKEKR